MIEASAPMNPAAARFFARFLLVHTHVEKTAGTTLVGHLTRLFGAEHVLDLRPAEVPRPAQLPPERRQRVWLLTGHFHRGAHERHFARKPIRLALVRQPVERLISLYKYVRNGQGHPGRERYAYLPLPEAVRRMIEIGAGPIRNQQCRTLTGLKEPKWSDVVYAVERDYAVVCTQSSVDRLTALFNARFGVEVPAEALNRGEPGAIDIDDETRRLVEETNALDFRLYEYVAQNEARLLRGLDHLLRATLPAADAAVAGAATARQQHTRPATAHAAHGN